MMIDAALAFLHFVFLLIMAGALAAEAFVLRLPINAAVIRLVARIDAFYGASAGALLAAGFARVYWGAKGAAYYWAEPFFWAKIAAFALVALISIPPTLRFFAWRAALRKDGAFAPPPEQAKGVRRLVLIELHLLALVVAFAVLMARGIRF
jgi:putative membrane protein